MSDGAIPKEITQFITEQIDSVAQLEALLLLRGAPGSPWSVPQLASRLYIDQKQTADILEWLCAQGLAVASGEPFLYQYRPISPELGHLVDELAEIYAKQLVPVTHLIHSKPRKIQQFANAFKLRKDD